ncbi:hypothetical protein LPJ61_003808 [Coemansia biformis]|uniref:Nicotinamide-nucleotide adenylyltransferase n=1 Tax=Coemansia biformis TaxID=1286918 RepID=A0A9W7YBV6_9FUNG|nr:hypothetical protein LPJ61_003808 [Coemansia biformis]
MSTFERHAVDSMRQVRKHTEIDDLRMMECDTPVYDDFVRRFVASHGAAMSDPVVGLARKYCETWPLPRRSDEGRGAAAATIRVGVMDSSFNPPHYCHGAYMECLGIMELLPASGAAGQRPWREARVLGIDAYLMLLGSANADKELAGASLEQRMRMVDMLATTVVQDTAADTWHLWKSREQFDTTNLHNMAIGMVNSPRFVDKCKAVAEVVRQEWAAVTHSAVADAPQVLSYFAMGWDTLIRVFDPKYYANYPLELDEFFANGGRIAYSCRVGFPDKDVEAFFASPEMAAYLQYIFELKLPKRVKHISSSDVRLAVRDSTQSVRDIPPRILEFVNSTQLYRKKA